MGKPFTECTVEELEGKAKTMKTLAMVLLIVMVLFVSYFIYKVSNGGEVEFALFIAPMCGLLAGAMPTITGLGRINKELERRKKEEGQ